MNIQPKKYYDMMGMQSGDSDLKNKNIGEVKRYWWISYLGTTGMTYVTDVFCKNDVINIHPFEWINKKPTKPRLLNYKEITKEEYEMF